MGSLADVVATDFLIVGAGPAGAALAAFMSQNGLKGLVVAKAVGTAHTPRAHVFSAFALETLRDLGVDKDAIAHGSKGGIFQSFRWCRSMVGEEYGKVLAWGAAPNSKRDLAMASPCEYLDLPQSYLEPILVKYASNHGFKFRFSVEFVDMEELPDSTDTLVTLRDRITNQVFQVRAKYVFGADGSRSPVAAKLGLKFHVEPRPGVAMNIIMKADLEHLIPRERYAGLHMILQPDNFVGIAPLLRMIRPWNEWILVCSFPAHDPRFENLTPQSPELLKFIHQVIGDETVPVEVQQLDPWNVNESVAETYSVEGKNVFVLGDAAHRHPPAHANGSNTCVQDAYNLAWKVAYVTKGLAGRKLLDSYSVERQPEGAMLVREANEQMGGHFKVWEALGIMAPNGEEGMKSISRLTEASAEGEKQRAMLHAALEGKRRECENLGLAMNQWYDGSSAIYVDDEPAPRPELKGNRVVEIMINTYPGNRLPHAWLDIATRRKEISTHDLAGHGAFSLFVGHGGEAWKNAAVKITKATGIPINAYGIGLGLDYIDVYRDWYKNRGVEEDGCVLVRPDRFVAWRSTKMVSDCEGKLTQVLNKILSRDSL
ncbi:FAD binding domain-containing protein [Xylariaceae sp. FL0255]|nr:FAD binding domain-containing protein [Xylariaceae sp. FL0255]